MVVGIVGLGLIGGSMARAYKRKNSRDKKYPDRSGDKGDIILCFRNR